MDRATELDCYDSILEKAAKKTIPLFALWELTYECNLRCRHCYVIKEPRKEELSCSEIKSVIDQLASLGCLYIVFTGGEVLTRLDFFEIAKYARKKGFAIRLLTNGTLITDDIADRIKDLCCVSVEMSLYAANYHIHDAITKVRGSYEKTIDAFRLLRHRRVNTVMKSVLMQETVKEFDDLKALAEVQGSRFIYDVNVIARNDGCKDTHKYNIEDRNLKDFFMQRIDRPHLNPVEIPDDSRICNAGFSTFSISPYGQVYPCLTIRKECGDLRKTDFAQIWQNSQVLNEIRSVRFRDLYECRDCRLLTYCSRCQGTAFLEDGDILGPSRSACSKAGILKTAVEQMQEAK